MPGIHLDATKPEDHLLTYSQPDSDGLSSFVQSFITKHMHFLEVSPEPHGTPFEKEVSSSLLARFLKLLLI
jgi:hypothetical protein